VDDITENRLERFRLNRALWGWSYSFPRPSPIVPCPAIGLEIGVTLAGERSCTTALGGTARFGGGEISTFNLGERYSTYYEPNGRNGREVGLVVRIERVEGWTLPSAVVALPTTERIVDRRLVELCQEIAHRTDRHSALPATDIEYEVRRFVERHADLRAGDPLEHARLEIHRHFHKPLYMRHFADVMGVHEATFARNFATRYGITPTRYRTMLRLKEAALLLATRPELSVRSVAVIVGFDDVSYFHRAFAAQFRMTPLALGRTFSGPVRPTRRPRNHRLTPSAFGVSSTAE
jgi:AraC-like DNA-binding protein